jgi:hypothetical protein
MTARSSKEGQSSDGFVCCQAGNAETAARCAMFREMNIGGVPLRHTELDGFAGETVEHYALRLAANCIVDRLAELGCTEFAD